MNTDAENQHFCSTVNVISWIFDYFNVKLKLSTNENSDKCPGCAQFLEEIFTLDSESDLSCKGLRLMA